MVADFVAAAVLISFGAVIGKASISQLIIMATIEVIVQSINEHIGLEYLKVIHHIFISRYLFKKSRFKRFSVQNLNIKFSMLKITIF